MDIIIEALRKHQAVMQQLEALTPLMHRCSQHVLQALRAGGKILWMGNGGSAADAQHLAAELVGRFQRERRALPSIALTTDSSILTCISNDYDFSKIFSRQIEALCRKEDVVIGISTSGNSLNVLKGIAAAKEIGAYTIGLTGHQGGQLASAVDLCLTVPSDQTARIQEAHIFMGHCICEVVESTMNHEEQNSLQTITNLE